MSSKKFMWDELCHFEAVISLVETKSLLQILGMCWFETKYKKSWDGYSLSTTSVYQTTILLQL